MKMVLGGHFVLKESRSLKEPLANTRILKSLSYQLMNELFPAEWLPMSMMLIFFLGANSCSPNSAAVSTSPLLESVYSEWHSFKMRSFTEVVAASNDDDDDEEEECLLPERKCFTRPDIVLEYRIRMVLLELYISSTNALNQGSPNEKNVTKIQPRCLAIFRYLGLPHACPKLPSIVRTTVPISDKHMHAQKRFSASTRMKKRNLPSLCYGVCKRYLPTQGVH